jgi:L-2-hydroxyglutarate oxidase LhgO
VGLAVATELAAAGRAPLVLERHPGPGREISSRNSGVIHAGIYYQPGSLKARLCCRGNRLLYAFCRRFEIPHRALGKLIVATDATERSALEALAARGAQNSVPGLRLLDEAEARRWEPAVAAVGALYSPTSGIVDAHELIKALEGRARGEGVELLYRCEVSAIEPGPTGYRLQLQRPGGREQLQARWLINAAGLGADRLAALAGVTSYRLHWCRGDYFAVSGGRGLASRLIYPVPRPQMTSLGVHLTLDLAGEARLGPDVTYVERDRPVPDVDPAKAPLFWQAARRYLPGLRLEQLHPDSWGLRPKLQGPGQPVRDFVIREESDRGAPQLIDLVGIESPGLTAALAIAEEVRRLVER